MPFEVGFRARKYGVSSNNQPLDVLLGGNAAVYDHQGAAGSIKALQHSFQGAAF